MIALLSRIFLIVFFPFISLNISCHVIHNLKRLLISLSDKLKTGWEAMIVHSDDSVSLSIKPQNLFVLHRSWSFNTQPICFNHGILLISAPAQDHERQNMLIHNVIVSPSIFHSENFISLLYESPCHLVSFLQSDSARTGRCHHSFSDAALSIQSLYTVPLGKEVQLLSSIAI